VSARFPRPLAGLNLQAGVLVERWVCRKADGNISRGRLPHESGEPVREWLRRQWWEVRGLVAMWHRLAARCPHVELGAAGVYTYVREAEFTIEHQAVALRFVVAACRVCPSDTTPDEERRARLRYEREIAEPSSCGDCGIGRRRHAAGHPFAEPTDEQILGRMRERRAARSR